eukprot:CAMPEP_0114623890 /NCGR_PEP_ID=MMETSP0168-20121206/10485_1 /TAXON_ID=95228 ORGANISM="Vannella sp., Strain DIVA3 517/6/12" /NCGR_SAMPLE_ID=MMETSP0168 /ASSEMBLY_ACC=CAM_ASM_000044 /LENGTH=706 /DNA_ID=CAMNT_0001835149 /DNA_START=33 /DNA_END=2151 /DNA_ORIENTATION=+
MGDKSEKKKRRSSLAEEGSDATDKEERKREKKEKKDKKDKKEKKEKSSRRKSTDAESANGVDKLAGKRKRDEEEEGAAASPGEKKKRKLDVVTSGAQTDRISEGEASLQNQVAITDLDITTETRAALEKKGYAKLFPVQWKTFNYIMKGNDIIVKARTGSGKTLGFVLPVVEGLRKLDETPKFGRSPRVLVMAPTRELAMQVSEEFKAISTGFSVCTVYGGAPYGPQENAMYRGCDIVVGTPGRIKDHIDRGNLRLDDIRYSVLDEADEMLNFGFAEAMENILGQITSKYQTLLFSATVPVWVNKIAEKYLKPNTKTVDFVGNSKIKTASGITHLAICCNWRVRSQTLADLVKVYAGSNGRSLVFTNTKKEANEIALSSSISNDCQVLHGDIIQAQREITLQGFKDRKFTCLVATDVAARGLDIENIELVIQCEPPSDKETYIHRSGRTGRAGKKGICITFYTPYDGHKMDRLQKAIGVKIERIGTPQLAQLADVAVENAETALTDVHPDMLATFAPYVKKLIANEMERQDADGDTDMGVMTETDACQRLLAAALAHISGFSQPQKKRSLLTSMEGYTTVFVKSEKKIFSPRYVMSVLGNSIAEDDLRRVKEIRLCEGGAVVDVPSELVEVLLHAGGYGIQFEECTELPELDERPDTDAAGVAAAAAAADAEDTAETAAVATAVVAVATVAAGAVAAAAAGAAAGA